MRFARFPATPRRPTISPQPDGNLLIFETAPTDGVTVRIAVRPSGTEPKIKFYLFARADVAV